MFRNRRALIFFLLVLSCVSFFSCSPYLVRAGWEEAGILLRRKKIEKLLTSSQIEPGLKDKLALVLEAREFAAELGLKPKESFTYYSKIDRDVLVWVVSGAKKTSFEPITWWFPIVGSIPYKGFFEKQDAQREIKRLEEKNLDTYLRPSVAFSTLGWFNDPVLSTVIQLDETRLVNTVIHEIVHNTVWIKDNVSFNETLANFIGAIGVQEFYKKKKNASLADLASRAWADEQVFAKHLEETRAQLIELYAMNLSEKETLDRRDTVFHNAVVRWQALRSQLQTNGYFLAGEKLSNASIMAHHLYLDRLQLFEDLYQVCNNSLPKFIEEIKLIVKESKNKDPFTVIKEKAAALKSLG